MNSVKTVLLIEDNLADARLLREMLRDDGSQETHLEIAETMSEAEAYLATTDVDIILLDLGLPDADGLAAVRRAHTAAPGVPLVVLTGLDDEGLAARALQEGAQDYLIKGHIAPSSSGTETRGLMRALRYAIERKAMDRNLLAESIRVERLKAEFVSTVSHELRTPLTSISGALALLIGNAAGDIPASATRLLKIAHANSQRLVRLVNDILDIEKAESGKLVFVLRPVDVCATIVEAIAANRQIADSSSVRVRFNPPFTTCYVRADSDRLIQVITNLLSNAIKFSPAAGEVVVGLAHRHDKIRISVRDEGSGISAEFKQRVFEKFAQGDTSDARQKGGTGLGLSIVKRLVTHLGGTVDFEDAPGGGTIFFVEFPWLEIMAHDQLDDATGPP